MRRLFIAILCVLLSGCYGLPPATESAVRDSIAADKGHMADSALPDEAREIAQDNHDVLWGILYGAGCEDALPKDVRERMEARTAPAPEGGGK